jgi:hypothetical protein
MQRYKEAEPSYINAAHALYHITFFIMSQDQQRRIDNVQDQSFKAVDEAVGVGFGVQAS